MNQTFLFNDSTDVSRFFFHVYRELVILIPTFCDASPTFGECPHTWRDKPHNSPHLVNPHPHTHTHLEKPPPTLAIPHHK